MRPLLIVFLLKLKVHLKMRVMSCIRSHNNVSYVMGQVLSWQNYVHCSTPWPLRSPFNHWKSQRRNQHNTLLTRKTTDCVTRFDLHQNFTKISTSNFCPVDSNVESKPERESLMILRKTFLLYAMILAQSRKLVTEKVGH